MFKRLDKLIIQAFIGPFAATFFMTLMVLVMQFFWLWIDDFVGKGLSTGVILEFIWYQSSVLVPLALPLAVLLSSLMTFGNLGESYELVAIKAAGISLLRFMRPLFFVVLFICGIAFLFPTAFVCIARNNDAKLFRFSVPACRQSRFFGRPFPCCHEVKIKKYSISVPYYFTRKKSKSVTTNYPGGGARSCFL